jgi:hypothetical protein
MLSNWMIIAACSLGRLYSLRYKIIDFVKKAEIDKEIKALLFTYSIYTVNL